MRSTRVRSHGFFLGTGRSKRLPDLVMAGRGRSVPVGQDAAVDLEEFVVAQIGGREPDGLFGPIAIAIKLVFVVGGELEDSGGVVPFEAGGVMATLIGEIDNEVVAPAAKAAAVGFLGLANAIHGKDTSERHVFAGLAPKGKHLGALSVEGKFYGAVFIEGGDGPGVLVGIGGFDEVQGEFAILTVVPFFLEIPSCVTHPLTSAKERTIRVVAERLGKVAVPVVTPGAVLCQFAVFEVFRESDAERAKHFAAGNFALVVLD